jgi:type VI secretion system protein ImpI
LIVSTPQTLLLAVIGHQAAQFGSRSQKAFEGRDGSIGRSEDCDWVLSSSGVSRVHAMIRYLNGIYFIEDRSTNGMLLNGRPLIKGDPSALKEGDRLQIDTFEVSVSLQSGNAETVFAPPPRVAAAPAPVAGDPLDFGLLDLAAPAASAPADLLGDSLIPGSDQSGAGAFLDPLSFLDAPPPASPLIPETPASSAGADWNQNVGLDDHFRPPATTGQRQALPENWDLTIGDFASAPPAASPAPAPAPIAPAPIAPPPASLAAAPATALPPELDQIFKIVIDGVMDVLRARAEIKNTFRLPVTIIQRSENNPLKFAPTAEEAMQKIMAPSNTAFLSGTAAFQDAFDDIRCHQMAMLAGVRAGFDSLMAHFNPDRIEHEVDGGKRSTFGGKGKYWEKYQDNFEGLMKDPDECFRRLFGDEFARAYEEQLSRLKSARRASHASGR